MPSSARPNGRERSGRCRPRRSVKSASGSARHWSRPTNFWQMQPSGWESLAFTSPCTPCRCELARSHPPPCWGRWRARQPSARRSWRADHSCKASGIFPRCSARNSSWSAAACHSGGGWRTTHRSPRPNGFFHTGWTRRHLAGWQPTWRGQSSPAPRTPTR